MKSFGLRTWRAVLGAAIAIGLIGADGVRPAAAQTLPAPAEIVELARALKSSPDLIYEYVYNNIETLPQYGSLKGPLGALLDGKGTAFDQAELMVALLQQSGFTASYQLGAIERTASQLTNWLGTDNSCGSLGFTLGSGGFPTALLPNPCASVATAAQIAWAWVVVDIGGTSFVFDPSTKAYNRSTGIGIATLASALGYTQSAFISGAETGATITSSSIAGLNRANIRSDLTSYASNLVQFIRTNSPAAATADIIGGKTIIPLALGTQQRQTSLSYAVGSVQNEPTIPTSFRTTLTLTLGSNDASNVFTPLSSAITFNSSDIYGHRIVASFNASLVPSLLLDGVTQATGSGAVPSGRRLTVRTTILHPYAGSFANVTNSDQVRVTPGANILYLIGTGWGQVGRGMIEKHRKLLQQSTDQNPGNATAEPVLGESLAMLGYTWLAEVSQQQQLVDQLGHTSTIYQHAVGVVGMKVVGSSVGPFVDLPINGFSIVQRNARPTSSALTSIETAAFFTEQIFASIAESGMLEQTQPGATAASTVSLIDTTVQSGGTIFDINNSAVSGNNCTYYNATIRPQLVNYSAGDLARIDQLVGRLSASACASPAQRVIAPANGSITVMQYTGAGYYQIAQDGSTIGSIITGGLSGGEPATPVTFDELAVNTFYSAFPAFSQSETATIPGVSLGNAGTGQITADPINLVTGDFLLNPTDLMLGSQGIPYGLGLQRYYDSGTRLRKGPLGYGWTHNFVITALPDSDAFEGLGINSPINGAAAIAATFVTFDILNTVTAAKPLDRIVIASVAQRWLMDKLTTNVVAVAQPGNVERFTKLADGSYNSPLGSAATLTSTGGAFTYVTKDRVTLSFNSAGDLATWSSPAGVTLTLNYSGTTPTLASVTNNLGRTLTFSYSSGSLTQVSDGNGRSVSYTYDASGNLATFTDLLGNATTYTYDLPGRLVKVFYPSRPGTASVTNTYDSLGRVKTQADANGSTWQYFLAGPRSEEINPLGMQHVIYTTPRGKTRTEIQDLQGLNRVTTNAYDALDRVTSTTTPEGNSVGYTYDTRSNVLTVTATPKPGSPLSPLTTTYTYESTFNKPTSVTDPRGLVTTMSYHGPTGNLMSIVADAGAAPHFNATSTFTYNNFGQVLTATDPLGTVTKSAYGAFGNQTSVTRDFGGLNQLTTMSYNAVGDVISVTDPNGKVSTSTFDAVRRLKTSITPATAAAPNGLVTALSYDADGRVVQTQQSASGTVLRTTSTTYTLTGKPATVTDVNGNVTRYAYDLLDRTASVTDAMDRVTSYGYDALSRRTQVFDTAVQVAPLSQQSYTPNGLVASLTDANGNATSFAYDGFDRLATTTYPGGSTETSTYDADNNVLSRKTRANGTITFTYDTLNRRTSKTPPSPAPVVSYGYDLAGRMTSTSDTSATINPALPPSPGTPVQYATSYTYDSLNRPIGVVWDPAPTAASPTASAVTFSHSYNKTNQRTGYSTTDNSWWFYPAATASTVSYSANALNQYTAVGAVTPSYDANGNLTGDGTFSYGYDSENRLISANGAGNTASYAYDAQGRRKLKTVNGTTTVSVTDADNREVLEYDGTSGSILRWYAHGLGSNDVLNQMNVAASTRVTFIPDLQGSIIATLDSSSGALSKRGYLPYGTSGSAAGTFAYTGQRIDAETSGLHYYRARMYATTWGRFLQPDPIGYEGGSNLYAYVGNDPLNRVDPLGLTGSTVGGGGSFWASTVALPGVAGAGAGAAGLGPAVALTLPLLLAGDSCATCTQAQNQDPYYYATYTRTNPANGQVYSGRTSGYGDPDELVRQRGLQQDHLNAERFLPPVRDVAATGDDAYAAIRGREQQLINFYGGAQSVGGTSRNMINGIADFNPRGPHYVGTSIRYFGALPDNSPPRLRLY